MKLRISNTNLVRLTICYRGLEVSDFFWKKACTRILKQGAHRLAKARIFSIVYSSHCLSLSSVTIILLLSSFANPQHNLLITFYNLINITTHTFSSFFDSNFRSGRIIHTDSCISPVYLP